MQSKRWKQLGVAMAFSLALAGSSPAFAQEQGTLVPSGSDPIAADQNTGDGIMDFVESATTHASSFSTAAAGAYGQPGDQSGASGIGHASDSSNNWMGDVAEGLSNQPLSDDSDDDNSASASDDTTDQSADDGSI